MKNDESIKKAIRFIIGVGNTRSWAKSFTSVCRGNLPECKFVGYTNSPRGKLQLVVRHNGKFYVQSYSESPSGLRYGSHGEYRHDRVVYDFDSNEIAS